MRTNYKFLAWVSISTFVLLFFFPKIYFYFGVNYFNYFTGNPYEWYVFKATPINWLNYFLGLTYNLLLSVIFGFIATSFLIRASRNKYKAWIILSSFALSIFLGIIYFVAHLFTWLSFYNYSFKYTMEAATPEILFLMTLYFFIALPTTFFFKTKYPLIEI